MLKLVYKIKPEEKAAELEWLREQKIYPSVQNSWDFAPGGDLKPCVLIGAIVSSESALTIKLRHPLKFQDHYS